MQKKFATLGGSPHVAPEGGSDSAWQSRGSLFKKNRHVAHMFYYFFEVSTNDFFTKLNGRSDIAVLCSMHCCRPPLSHW